MVDLQPARSGCLLPDQAGRALRAPRSPATLLTEYDREEVAMARNVWSSIGRERQALADDLAEVPVARWGEPSLCAGWNVRQALAHIVGTARMSTPSFIVQTIATGGRLHLSMDRAAKKNATRGHVDLLAQLRDQATKRSAVIGSPLSWLAEIVVHGYDIRLPLAINHQVEPDVLIRVADYYARTSGYVGSKKRVAGLRLRATDTDWSHGSGHQEVTGTMPQLILAMTGRRGPLLDGLSGSGAALLVEP